MGIERGRREAESGHDLHGGRLVAGECAQPHVASHIPLERISQEAYAEAATARRVGAVDTCTRGWIDEWRNDMDAGRKTITNNNSRTKDLLLRYPNFVAKSPELSFEQTPLTCEASALTTELTAQNQTYFTRKSGRRKQTPSAS